MEDFLRFLSFTDQQVADLIASTQSDDDSAFEDIPFSYPNTVPVDFIKGSVVHAIGTARLGKFHKIALGGGIVLDLPRSFRAAAVCEGLVEARHEMNYLRAFGRVLETRCEQPSQSESDMIASYIRAVKVHIALAHVSLRLRAYNSKRSIQRAIERSNQQMQEA